MNNQIKQSIQSFRRHSGFTMLEVVIAMAIGAVGIMAFIGLQLKAVEISEDSRKRANAAFLAEEMAERMMSNAQDYSAQRVYRGEAGSYWNQTAYDYGYFYAPINCMGAPASPTCSDTNTTAAAYYDILEVKYLAKSMLPPNGNIGHRKCGTANAFDCIVVAWDDADVNTCTPQGMDGTGVADCYVLQLKIW